MTAPSVPGVYLYELGVFDGVHSAVDMVQVRVIE